MSIILRPSMSTAACLISAAPTVWGSKHVYNRRPSNRHPPHALRLLPGCGPRNARIGYRRPARGDVWSSRGWRTSSQCLARDALQNQQDRRTLGRPSTPKTPPRTRREVWVAPPQVVRPTPNEGEQTEEL